MQQATTGCAPRLKKGTPGRNAGRVAFPDRRSLTLTELSQELGEGGGGEVVGLVRIATKVIQGFIYLKLNYLSSGAPTMEFQKVVWDIEPPGPDFVLSTSRKAKIAVG